MSLQLAAQHLSSTGRGNDSTLVHMSPREVKSLNDLAMAHGGQLTINPQTGLPEAGFLESILPMVAGAALTAAGVPAGMAAFGVGAGMTLMTGSLEKGLMAGLGAYGGASLGGSLMAGGASPAAAGISEANAATAAQAAAAPVAPPPVQPSVAAATPAVNPMPAVNLPPQGAMNAADLRSQMNLASGSDFLAPATQVAPAPIAPEVVAPTNFNYPPLISNSSPALHQQSLQAPASFMDNIKAMGSNISPSSLMNFAKENPMQAASGLASLYSPKKKEEEKKGDSDLGERAKAGYKFDPGYFSPFPQPDPTGRGIEQSYGKPRYYIPGKADGGIATDPDRPTETPALQAFKQMQAQRAAQPPAPQIDVQQQYQDYVRATTAMPEQAAQPATPQQPTPYETNFRSAGGKDSNAMDYLQTESEAANPFNIDNRPVVGYTATGEKIYGEQRSGMGMGGFGVRYASGGLSDAGYNLGGYSDGGRLLRGPGDGVSDSIPAVIGKKQPARLADGEFVVPARIVSELGNGSTEAGARKLYAMMDRIQKARGKTIGKNKVAKNSRSEKYLPA